MKAMRAIKQRALLVAVVVAGMTVSAVQATQSVTPGIT